MIRKILAASVAVTLLAGCGSGSDAAAPGSRPASEFAVTTIDVNGRQVTCITWKNRNRGGLSCDWNAQQ